MINDVIKQFREVMCSCGWSQFGVICEVKQCGGMKRSEPVWKSRA